LELQKEIVSKEKISKEKIKLSDYLYSALILFAAFLIVVGLFSMHKYVIVKGETDQNEAVKFVYFSVVVLLLFAILYLYLMVFYNSFFKNRKKLYLIAVLIIFCLETVLLFGMLNKYLRPFGLIVMFGTIFFTRHIGFFFGILNLILTQMYDFFENGYKFGDGFGAGNGNYQFSQIIIGIFFCVTALIFTSMYSQRFKTVLIGLQLAASLFILTFFLEMLFIGNNSAIANAAISMASGILTILLYIFILPLFEKSFNLVTVYRLVELTDHDKPLLKRLMTEAPGTFNHSLVVANLTEACAAQINENIQLARAAAYYHDIGKLVNPSYFKENQGEYNPHDDLTPELSTEIIKKHTKDGYNLIKKYHLPQEIADICMQHHGTMLIKVFYYKALKFTDGGLDVDKFCYDGQKPKTKIAAIIMLADASEAAVRTLIDHGRDKVEEIVNTIIEERLESGQFTDCDITMREIYAIRDTIVSSTTGMYHGRLQYPKVKMTGVMKSR